MSDYVRQGAVQLSWPTLPRCRWRARCPRPRRCGRPPRCRWLHPEAWWRPATPGMDQVIKLSSVRLLFISSSISIYIKTKFSHLRDKKKTFRPSLQYLPPEKTHHTSRHHIIGPWHKSTQIPTLIFYVCFCNVSLVMVVREEYGLCLRLCLSNAENFSKEFN